MLKTCWVEPGEGATVGELVGAMGGLPPGFAAGGTRTSLAIVGEGKVMFDAYDRIRAIEALERVGVRVGEGEGGGGAREVVVATVARPGEPDEPSMPQWPKLAEKLLSAAQAVVEDARANDEIACDGPMTLVDWYVFDRLRDVIREIHREAVNVIERERSRNR